MKFAKLLLPVLGALTLAAPIPGRAQTLLDLLKTIQPGQPAPAQPPPPPTVVTNTQTIIIYSNTTPQSPSPAAPTQPAVLDTRPAFLAYVTNYVTVTNRVIVTNYVVSTKPVITTNYYNAQGQFLQPVQPAAPPPIPGLVPIAPAVPTTPTAVVPKPPAAPDPRVVLAGQQQAVRELLSNSAAAAGKRLATTGSFNDPAHQIQIPEGMTVFDRAKANRLLTAMNTAAEKAAPEVTQLLQSAIARLNPADAAAILKGAPDAAVRLLFTTEGQNLSNQTLTIVKRTGVAAGLPDAHQSAMLKGGGLLGGLLGAGPSVDIDTHVTKGVLAAFVKNIADQERVIRTTPAARSTPTLQNAFK